jgi:hypothetical protein
VSRQLLTLSQNDALVPLFHMLNVLSKDWVEGILLTCLDLKVDVAMAVLCFTESHLVVELCLLEGLLVRIQH